MLIKNTSGAVSPQLNSQQMPSLMLEDVSGSRDIHSNLHEIVNLNLQTNIFNKESNLLMNVEK